MMKTIVPMIATTITTIVVIPPPPLEPPGAAARIKLSTRTAVEMLTRRTRFPVDLDGLSVDLALPTRSCEQRRRTARLTGYGSATS